MRSSSFASKIYTFGGFLSFLESQSGGKKYWAFPEPKEHSEIISHKDNACLLADSLRPCGVNPSMKWFS